MCRITVNGKIAQVSCTLDVEEKSWNVKSGRVSGRSIVAQEANRMLDKIRVGIDRAYQQISDRDNYVTAEKVRNAYLGLGMNHETLLAVFRQHNEDYEKQVGKLKSLRSYWKYCVVYKHLAEFVKKRYIRVSKPFSKKTPCTTTRPANVFVWTAATVRTCIILKWLSPLHSVFVRRAQRNYGSIYSVHSVQWTNSLQQIY